MKSNSELTTGVRGSAGAIWGVALAFCCEKEKKNELHCPQKDKSLMKSSCATVISWQLACSLTEPEPDVQCEKCLGCVSMRPDGKWSVNRQNCSTQSCNPKTKVQETHSIAR